MINFPNINNINPFAKKQTKRYSPTVHRGQSDPKPDTPYRDRRRQKDRRKDDNEWPVDSREGRDRRKSSPAAEDQRPMIDTTA